MAGDWIKMSTDLRTHPKVVRISSALKADRFRVIGGLHAVWCLFDAHSVDGSLEGYTLEALDDLIGWPGFSAAMVAVEWINVREQALDLPRFSHHNGQSAKRRAQETDRKRMSRASAETSAPDADQKRSREEKSREEKKEKKEPPAALTIDDLFNEGVTREAAAEWIAVRKRKKAGPVTPLAWSGFKAQAVKAGWGFDAAVRKCVERNWISFEADWVQSSTGETLREKRARERVHEMTGGLVSARPPGQPQQPGVFDVPLAIGMD